MAEYPKEILPRKEYLGNIDTALLLEKQSNAVIGHWLDLKDCTRQKYIDELMGKEFAQLTTDALPIENMANLSCSLLGAIYGFNHFAFVPKAAGKSSWDKCSDISDDMLVADNFRTLSEYLVVAWEIKELAGVKLPYVRSFDKKSQYESAVETIHKIQANNNEELAVFEEWEKIAQKEGSNLRDVELEGVIHVNHDPTNLNYWHFTIDLKPMDKEAELKGIKSGWQKNMANELFKILRLTFFEIDANYKAPEIEPSVWIKSE